MDEGRFDRLARLMAPASRRTSIKVLGGALLATLVTRTGIEDAAAKCVDLGAVCKTANGKKKRCCIGICSNKKCKCPNGQKPCGQDCILLDNVCE